MKTENPVHTDKLLTYLRNNSLSSGRLCHSVWSGAKSFVILRF